MAEGVERPLGRYRVLEMPGVAPLIAGKTFADLGADVIKVEPPGGDPARRLPPLIAGSEGAPGLVWAAYHAGKRSVTVDLESEAGRAFVQRLAREADVLIEAFAPGELARFGLGYGSLRRDNPGLVLTSITSFGQDGPYAGRRGSDLIHFAMGGYLHMTGPGDGPPLKPSAPIQSYLHAAMQSIAATLLALRLRERTGRGAHVDQAIRDTGMWMLTHTYQFWDLLRVNLRRQGASRDMGGARRLRSIYRCKDGLVVWMANTGHIGGPSMNAFVAWMHAEGMAPHWLRAIDWLSFDYLGEGQALLDQMEDAFGAFLTTKTKAELLEWALANRLMMAPVQTLRDLLGDPQLAAREAWRTTVIEGASAPVSIPGPPVRMSAAVWETRNAERGTRNGDEGTEQRGKGNAGNEVASVATDLGESGKDAAETGDLQATSPDWRARAEPGGVAAGPTRSAFRAPRSALPLAGLRVVDFSTTVAGPSASRHLADFGAEVIKVESQAHPDGLRAATPYAGRVAGPNRSGYFAAYNAGKKSFALNMQKPESRAILRRLIERADVLIEAYVPGVVERWGLTWEQVSAWNPRLIMASHCLQGQWGPRAKHRGFGQIASAMSGWYDLTGLPGEEPVGPYSAYTDFICWPFLLTSILVALEMREQTGRGQRIDHAQLETSIHFLTPLLLDLQVNGHLATRRGNREDYAAPNHAYPCGGPSTEDQWIAITVTSDGEWAALCRAMGHEEAVVDPRFATHAARKAHEDKLDAMLAEWVRGEDAFALSARLQAGGVAAGPVQRAQDLFADPQLQHRGFFRRLPHPELGEHAVLTQTFRIEGVKAGPFRAAPLLGEHTYEICTNVLGMSDDEIAEYTARGVFE